MKRALRGAAFSVALLLAFHATAEAQGTRDWFTCGGDLFHTCASVQLTVGDAVDGVSSVQLKIWNLSGMDDTWGASVFTKIGFFNTGGASAVANSLAMSGPVRVREGRGQDRGTLVDDTPEQWTLQDPNNAGGIALDLVSASSDDGSVNDGIASECDPDELPGGNNQLWQNPCHAGPDAPDAGAAGWVTLDFQSTGTWDLASTELLIQAQNGPDGMSTQCITGQNCFAAPEPTTGLLGLAGVGLVRRRREEEDGNFGSRES